MNAGTLSLTARCNWLLAAASRLLCTLTKCLLFRDWGYLVCNKLPASIPSDKNVREP
jgi:hypothetical protein